MAREPTARPTPRSTDDKAGKSTAVTSPSRRCASNHPFACFTVLLQASSFGGRHSKSNSHLRHGCNTVFFAHGQVDGTPTPPKNRGGRVRSDGLGRAAVTHVLRRGLGDRRSGACATTASADRKPGTAGASTTAPANPLRHQHRPTPAPRQRRPAQRSAATACGPQAPPADPNAPAPPSPEPGGSTTPRRIQLCRARRLEGLRRHAARLHGPALLSKIPAAGPEQAPTDTSVLLGRWTRSCTPAPKPTTPRRQPGSRRTWVNSSCRTRAPGSIRRPRP